MNKDLIFLEGFKGESLANVVDYWSTVNKPSELISVTDNAKINRAIEIILQELGAAPSQPDKPLTYLNVKDGEIIKAGAPLGILEGYLEKIELRDREFRGETVKYWYINIDATTGERYSLALPYQSGVAKSLFNSLASAQDYSDPIQIETYLSGGYTKVKVSQSGERLSWSAPELPPIKEIRVGSKVVKDDSERMKFIENLATEINNKL